VDLLFTVATEPLPIRDAIEPAAVGVADIEVAMIAHQELRLVPTLVANVAIVCEGLNPVVDLLVYHRLKYLNSINNFVEIFILNTFFISFLVWI
jgi:hypothetical protein